MRKATEAWRTLRKHREKIEKDKLLYGFLPVKVVKLQGYHQIQRPLSMQSTAKRENKSSVSLQTAIAIVVANMIGTGVFTSLGYQLVDIQSVFVIVMLWLVGGITALCGALTYGELGAALPRSGGEYNFLSEIYHPSVGFVAGWVSATVGFAAPTALVAMTFGAYATSVFPALNSQFLAIGLLILVTAIHAYSVWAGGRFQRVFTLVKVVLIIIFIFLAFILGTQIEVNSIIPKVSDFSQMLSPAFAVALIYVSYAYTGWNAGTYLTSELENPQVNLPKALIIGTASVTVLYVLLNFAFLYTAPISALEGQLEIGYISATYMVGESGGKIMAAVLSLLLISTASAMIFAGPRVLVVMGEDMKIFRFLAVKNENGAPMRAVLFQSGISLLFILSGTFEQVLVYAGFVLAATTFIAVAGVFVLRIRQPDLPRPYKTLGYPFTPAIYLGLVGWTLVFLLRDKPTESLLGLGTMLAGWIVYQLGSKSLFENEARG